MNKKVLSFFLIGFLIYLFDYSFNENEDENVITIYDDEIQVLIKNWNEQVGRPPREEDIRGIIDQLIEEEILYREAVKLYRQARAHDDGRDNYTYFNATHRLGLLYYKGLGVEKDQRKGIRFIKEASDNGIIEAKDDLKNLSNN